MGHYIYKSIPDAKFEVDRSFSFGDMTSQNFLKEGNKSSDSTIYPRKTGLTLKKTSFYVQNRSSRSKIDPPMSISTTFKQRKIFHFQNFWDVSMTKEQQQPP